MRFFARKDENHVEKLDNAQASMDLVNRNHFESFRNTCFSVLAPVCFGFFYSICVWDSSAWCQAKLKKKSWLLSAPNKSTVEQKYTVISKWKLSYDSAEIQCLLLHWNCVWPSHLSSMQLKLQCAAAWLSISHWAWPWRTTDMKLRSGAILLACYRLTIISSSISSLKMIHQGALSLHQHQCPQRDVRADAPSRPTLDTLCNDTT